MRTCRAACLTTGNYSETGVLREYNRRATLAAQSAEHF